MKKQKRKNVSASKIAKCQAEGKKRKVSVDICDWGEPSCWACGYYKHPDDYSYKPTDKNPYACWDRAKFLEKAHIVPFALTGDDSPENFVLLCSACHAKNPNISNVKMYQIWLATVEPYEVSSVRGYNKVFSSFGIAKEDLENVLSPETGLFTSEFSDFLGANVMEVSGKINPMTVASAILAYSSETCGE